MKGRVEPELLRFVANMGTHGFQMHLTAPLERVEATMSRTLQGHEEEMLEMAKKDIAAGRVFCNSHAAAKNLPVFGVQFVYIPPRGLLGKARLVHNEIPLNEVTNEAAIPPVVLPRPGHLVRRALDMSFKYPGVPVLLAVSYTHLTLPTKA